MNGNLALPLASLGVTSINPGFTTASLELNAGDTIDFVVGNYGDFYFDNTPIEVSIAAVPEPHPMWLLLAGIPLIVRRMARRPDA